MVVKLFKGVLGTRKNKNWIPRIKEIREENDILLNYGHLAFS